MTSRTLGHRAPILWLALPLMAGLATGKAGEIAPVPWLLGGALLAALFANFAAWHGPRGWAPAIAVTMFLAGNASYTLHRDRLSGWDGLPPREARLSLRVDRVFPQADVKRATGLATVVRANDPVRAVAGQRIYFSLALRKGETAPARSAVVATVGLLAPLARNPPADSFDGYLASAGMNFRFSRGRVLAIEQPPTRYYAFLERAAARLNELLSAGIAQKRPEFTAVFRAMMLGQKHELSDEQDAQFMQPGSFLNGRLLRSMSSSAMALFSSAKLKKRRLRSRARIHLCTSKTEPSTLGLSRG